MTIQSSAFGNTFFENEEWNLKLIPLNTYSDKDVTLKTVITITDAYGSKNRCIKTFAKIPRATSASPVIFGIPTTIGEAEFCLFNPKVLGHYRISIQTIELGRAFKLPLQEMTAAVVPPVYDFSFDDDASLGYFALDLPSDPSARNKAAKQMRSFGIKWVRFAYRGYWDGRSDAPDFSAPDWLQSESDFISHVDNFREFGIQVLAQPFGSPRWASQFPDDLTPYPDSGSAGWQIAAPRADAWEKILSELANRLKGKVKHWEIWNEPESYIYFDPQSRSDAERGQKFRDLLIQSSEVLKAIDPENKTVVNPAYFTLPNWNSVVFSAITNPHLDIYGVHYGGANDPAAIENQLTSTYGLSPKPYWNTEAYGKSSAVWGNASSVFPKNFLWQKAAGVDKSFLFIYNLQGIERFGDAVVKEGTYQPSELAPAIRVVADKVGSATLKSYFKHLNNTYSSFQFHNKQGQLVVALVSERDISTWGEPFLGRIKIKLRCAVNESFKLTDLMGNNMLSRRDARKLSETTYLIRMRGTAIFLEGFDPTCASNTPVIEFL